MDLSGRAWSRQAVRSTQPRYSVLTVEKLASPSRSPIEYSVLGTRYSVLGTRYLQANWKYKTHPSLDSLKGQRDARSATLGLEVAEVLVRPQDAGDDRLAP